MLRPACGLPGMVNAGMRRTSQHFVILTDKTPYGEMLMHLMHIIKKQYFFITSCWVFPYCKFCS